MESPSGWIIGLSGEYKLNFPIYVGCVYGLFVESGEEHQRLWPAPKDLVMEDKDKRALKEQWDQWWNRVVMLLANNYANKSYELGPGIGIPENHFDDIEGNLLRQCCIDSWPAFVEWWNMPAGGQVAMYYWENFPRVNKYVEEYEQLAGRKIKPFSMSVNLVYTGITAPIEPVNGYIIMPIDGPYLITKDWWLERFKQRY
ncbi:hypothetical protein D3C71_580230 [compost metagenome]